MGRSTPPGAALAAAAVVAATLAAVPTVLAAQDTVPFTPGMVVTSSVRVAPGTYRMAGPADLEEALIVVRGSDLTLDLSGVVLEGIDPAADPDLGTGVAVRIDGGADVTVRGATIRGYRFGVLARGTRNLQVLDNELSYAWKPRLFSLVGHESLVDWLSFHDNEDRNWMRFGAALYLEDVTGGVVAGNRMVQGMNGMLLTRTDSLLVADNDASYNSGLGLGLYRSSHNVVVRNRFEYDVRGYSEGFYQRGQDSAGLLVYEQSSHNLVAYNSATHSGDGFFLWAGNSTMDTGQGGANDNTLFHNDFSFAPTNAVEVTFSRNRIVGNWLEGSRYGVWGGYSWETEILGNCFGGNQFGVAIEHGQDNRIVANRFDRDSLAVSLWGRESQPDDWGYPRNRDVRSRDHVVAGNRFHGVREVWRLERTEGHRIGENRVEPAGPLRHPCEPTFLVPGSVQDSLVTAVAGAAARLARGVELPGGPLPAARADLSVPRSGRARLPRSAIVVDEWGPYDGRSPTLWPTDTTRLRVPLQVLGPPGRWRVTGRYGVDDVSAEAGVPGDTLVVTPAEGAWHDWSVDLEYVGQATVSPRGAALPAGVPVPFGFRRFEPLTGWDVRFFAWDDPAADPHVDAGAWRALISGEPAFTRTEDRLDYQWFRPLVDGLPQERWGLVAEAEVALPPGGPYALRTISDDGVRVWVDGRLVLDAFEPHGARVDYAPLTAGTHDVRVTYFQLDGWTELRLDVVQGDARSPGSPGPH